MESTSAALQSDQINIQLKALEQERLLHTLNLMLLLNTTDTVMPHEGVPKLKLKSLDSVTYILQHPDVELAQQSVTIAKANVALEKTSLLPSFNIGYYNQTMRDINSNRFHAVQLGIGVPIFSGAQHARIRASYLFVEATTQQLKAVQQQYQITYQKAMTLYQTQLDIVNQYEQQQLPKATLVFEVAQQQFDAGEIDYLGWVVLTNQAIQLQTNYMDALSALNQRALEINYLTIKEH
jgi:cobalt-zinc-cadmium resistance protein CzcA